MKQRYYGVELTSVGSNYEKVFSYIKKLYPRVSDSEIRSLLDDCNAGDVVPVSDCISEARANEIHAEVVALGAKATVYEMSDEEIKSAIETGDIVEETSKSPKSSQQEVDVSPIEEYQANRKLLWRFMIFCMIGWAIAAIGFGVMNMNDIAGFVMIIVGVIIVDLPAYKVLIGGFSLGSLFYATAPVYLITYKSGRQTVDRSAKHGAAAAAIFTYLITLVVGVFVMVFRIFKCIATASKIKRQHKLSIKFKDSIWLPTFVGLGEFAVFCVVIAIISAVAEHQATHPTSMSKEQIVQLLDTSKQDIVHEDFSYYVCDYGEEVYDYHTRVLHAGVDDSYLVMLGDKAKEYYQIDAGNYLYFEGKWELVLNIETKETTATTFGDKLDQFRIENLVDYDGMKNDMNNVYGDNENAVYDLIFWHKKVGGMRGFDFDKSGNIINIKNVLFSESLMITINYDLNFGGAFN